MIQRKRGKKRHMLFRSPEKTQRIRVKLFVPTAQLPNLLGIATLGLLWSMGMLWKPRLTAGQTVDAHLYVTVATSHSQSVRLFRVCRVLSKSGFRYARANKTKQVSPELPCQLSGETSPWSSARVCGWADRTLVVLTIPKPRCCCFLWSARLVGCGFLQSSC